MVQKYNERNVLKNMSLDNNSNGIVIRMDDFIKRKRKYDYQTDPIVQRMRDADPDIFSKSEKDEMLDNIMKEINSDLEEDSDKVLKEGMRTLYKLYCNQVLSCFSNSPTLEFMFMVYKLKYATIKNDEYGYYVVVSDKFMKLSVEEIEKVLEDTRHFVMDKIYSIGKENQYISSWANTAKSKDTFEKEIEELETKYKQNTL